MKTNGIVVVMDIEYKDLIIDVEVEFIAECSDGYDYDNNGDGCPEYSDYEIVSIYNPATSERIFIRDLKGSEMSKIDNAIELEISEL